MNREVHVRFWEGVEVRFLCATQLSQSLRLGIRCQGQSGYLPHFLQYPPAPPVA